MKKIIFIVLAILGLFMGCEVKNPTLPDETIPTAFVTYPANEETVTDNQINLSFDVDNETSIDSVQVYFNGNKIASLLQRPYQIMISKEDYEVGTQTIYCKAFDIVSICAKSSDFKLALPISAPSTLSIADISAIFVPLTLPP